MRHYPNMLQQLRKNLAAQAQASEKRDNVSNRRSGSCDDKSCALALKFAKRWQSCQSNTAAGSGEQDADAEEREGMRQADLRAEAVTSEGLREADEKAERAEMLAFPTGWARRVLEPRSRKRLTWRAVLLVATLYNALCVPLTVAFAPTDELPAASLLAANALADAGCECPRARRLLPAHARGGPAARARACVRMRTPPRAEGPLPAHALACACARPRARRARCRRALICILFIYLRMRMPALEA